MSLEHKVGAGVAGDIKSMRKGINFGLALTAAMSARAVGGIMAGIATNFIPYIIPYLLNDFDKYNTGETTSNTNRNTKKIDEEKHIEVKTQTESQQPQTVKKPRKGSFNYYFNDFMGQESFSSAYIGVTVGLPAGLISFAKVGTKHLEIYANQIEQGKLWALLLPVATTVASYIHCKYIQEKRRS